LADHRKLAGCSAPEAQQTQAYQKARIVMASIVKRIDRPNGHEAAASELLDRLPPQNLDAEKGVLGSLLLVPELCDEVSLVVRAEDFYSDANQKIYTCMLDMHNSGGRIDHMLLVEQLKKCGDLEAIGGMAYLVEVAQAAPVASHAIYYARIVQEKATLRALIRASTDILRDAYDAGIEAREMLSRAEEKVFSILEQKGSGDIVVMRDVLHEAMLRIDARLKQEHDISGVETGFADLDALTGGLHESELIILAARPSMGKTAFAANIAEHVAIERKVTTLFVSLEMSRLELADRMLCSYAKINGHKLRNGTITSAERRELVQKAAEMSMAPLYIDDTPSRTMTEIAATARRLKRKEKLGFIVIDYLQLIEPDNSKDPRQEQVAKIARRLKGLARELKVPLLCLAQLNRQAEVTKDNRPRLSHLRESGAIEQDADVVMFVHREEYYHSPQEIEERGLTGQAEIVLAKQRNGPTGDIKLVWQKDYTRFVNAAGQEWQSVDPF
jgi:replicative DNA helicase